MTSLTPPTYPTPSHLNLTRGSQEQSMEHEKQGGNSNNLTYNTCSLEAKCYFQLFVLHLIEQSLSLFVPAYQN